MHKEMIFGRRMFSVSIEDRHALKVYGVFEELIKGAEEELTEIMDRYQIPDQILLNFKKGNGYFDGTFFAQNKEVSEHMIIIDIYTGHLNVSRSKVKRAVLKLELMDTFIHELVHNKYKSERKTYATAGKLAREIMRCLQKRV